MVLNEEDEESKELWKIADAGEWGKICSSGAVQVLSLEESREVKRKLSEEGEMVSVYCQLQHDVEVHRVHGG